MKRWIVFILFSILLSYPAVSGAIDDTFDTGRTTMFNCPFLKVPIGDGAAKDKKEDEQASHDDKKEKAAALDKKVDDAIKKAWGEK
jgi:hypothetical protein